MVYNLNEFCNIISQLRRKGWTQAELAERLDISPQSVSKWECGIGFPDVTLFPIIAETLSVPIGVLFGEKIEAKEGGNRENRQEREAKEGIDRENRQERTAKEKINMESRPDYQYGQCKKEYMEEFEKCRAISVRCGNVCRVEVISGISEKGHVHAVGDPVFLHYFSLEYVTGQKEADGLLINIKNPTGSSLHWHSYDRQGYTGENFVQIFTGGSDNEVDVAVYNYLDLDCVSGTNARGNFEVVCRGANKDNHGKS